MSHNQQLERSGDKLESIDKAINKSWLKKPEAWFSFIAMITGIAAVIISLCQK